MKNKQSFIAALILLVLVFNTCSNPTAGSNTIDFTPMYFYVDANGNFTEKDSGRTVFFADDKADVIFYSDNVASSADRVGFAFEDKTIVFFFGKNSNFPISMVLSDSEGSYDGFFTAYDPVSQTYGLTVKQGSDKETWSDIALNKEVISQFKDDPGLSPSQNERMHNMYVSMCIYISLHDFFNSVATLQSRGIIGLIGTGINKAISQIFVDYPKVVAISNIVLGIVQAAEGISYIFVASPTVIGSVLAAGEMAMGFANIMMGFQMLNPPVQALSGSGGGSSGDGGTTTTVSVTGVSLNKSSVNLVVGAVETLIPTINPSNATNKVVSWSSSNTAVATVSASGTVTGLSVGSATITVITNNAGKTATCNVTVNPVPVTGVTMNKATTNMLVDGTETLSAEVEPSNAANKAVNWSSSNTAVATVSSGGVVTAIAPGTSTIIVTTVDGSYVDSCTVTVSAITVSVTGVSLDKTSANIVVSGIVALIPSITPMSATNQNVTWSSSNTTVAAVSNSGVVTGVGVGPATITASTVDGGYVASCNVTVAPYYPNGHVFNVSSTAEWNEATAGISNNGNNRTYTITVNGNVPVYGSTEKTFGSVSSLSVTLNGNGKLYLVSQGYLLYIYSSQAVSINSAGLTLQGLTSGQNGSSQDNENSIIRSSGSLELLNGIITGNSCSNSGAGVSVGGGIFSMTGGTISGNHILGVGGFGGGVSIYNSAQFLMSGGTISGNSCWWGGGVYISAQFLMSGGTISDNMGGGLVVTQVGNFAMSGGTIRSNYSSGYSNFGGVFIESFGALFAKTGGIIYGNDTYLGTYDNTSFSAHGHAVRWGYDWEDPFFYRNITLNEGDNISTANPSTPPWNQ